MVLLLGSCSPFNINLSVEVPSTLWHRGGKDATKVMPEGNNNER